jgi:hypothetical protein
MKYSPTVWKVIHAKDGVETVYLVAASSSREAEGLVLDEFYEREHPIHWTPEEKARDVLGLMLPTGTWTNYALCKQHKCSINAVPFAPDPPYRLYAIDTKTGAMS